MNNLPKSIHMEELSPLITGLIDSGTDVTITVVGNSMFPLLCNYRDTVTLTKCDKHNLKKGQIPLYLRQDGTYVLHRIIKVNENTYDMLGDSQTIIERDVPKENVLCVVKGFTRKNKYHDCESKIYRLYSWVWILARPIRKLFLKSYMILYKIIKE